MSAFDTHRNLASGTVAAAPSPHDSGTVLVLATGQGSRFAPNMPCTFTPNGAEPNAENSEIGYITAVVGDQITVSRAQEGSAAKMVDTSWIIRAGGTVKTFADIEAAVLGKANTADLALVATTGSYEDLDSKPFIPHGSDIYTAPLTSPPAAANEGDLWWVTDDAGGGPIQEGDVIGLVSDLASTEKTANKNAASGYASLDSNSRILNTSMRPYNSRGFVANSTAYNVWDTLIYKNKRILITNPVTSSSTGFIGSGNYNALDYINSVDIRDFGAAVDGSQDDTAAIQAAINYFGTQGTSTVGTGGIVRIPPGITRTSATIDLPSNVHLVGAGFSATCIQLLPNSNCHMITTHKSTGSGNSNAYWSSVSNLMLDGRRDNQGWLLTDTTLIPGTTSISSTAGTFQANGTLIRGIGIMPDSYIVSGGGTGTAVISQPITISALQQTPGASTVYQGGTTDGLGLKVPWCGIYHQTNPYNTTQTGDNQFDPTHTFQSLRIYFINGDGIRIHGRSDIHILNCKVSFAVGNGYTLDFDTKLNNCSSEKVFGHGLEIPNHSVNLVTNSKFYNSYGHGIYIHGSGGEISITNVDSQQNNLDGINIDSSPGIIFDGNINQAGFVNASSSIQTMNLRTWAASTVYNNFRSGGVPSNVRPVAVNGYVYACYTAGTSGASEPTWPTTVGNTVSDGTVTWVCLSALPASIVLNNASSNIISATAQNDLSGIRLTGTSTKNMVKTAHISGVTGQRDVALESVTLQGSGNDILINGASLTKTLALDPDVQISSPGTNQFLQYNGSKWVNAAAPGTNYLGTFGDGSGGTVLFDGFSAVAGAGFVSGVYTLTRDIQAGDITISSGITVRPASFKLFCTGTLTNQGTISADGNPGVGAAAGANTGNGAFGGGQVGGAGQVAAGSAGTGGGVGVGNGGAGGLGPSGAGGSAGSSQTTSNILLKNPNPVLVGLIGYNGGSQVIRGGSGGGGGGGDSTNKGGGGGSGGGIIAILAHSIINNGVMTAVGGGGAAGVAGNSGGGGGGGGGAILLYSLTLPTGSGTLVVTGGTGGALSGTGANGVSGGLGSTLTIVVQ